MLFLVRQDHAPHECPLESGGTEALHADPKDVEGIKVLAAYGSYAEHALYYLVETDEYDAITRFLMPALGRAHSVVTPVSQFMG